MKREERRAAERGTKPRAVLSRRVSRNSVVESRDIYAGTRRQFFQDLNVNNDNGIPTGPR